MLEKYSLSHIYCMRLYNSYVSNPTYSFETVASSLFGVQSQVPHASAIAFAVRTEGKTFSQFSEALNSLRLIRLWGPRTTLHFYCRDDWDILLSQLSSTKSWYEKKMLKQGIDIAPMINQVLDIIRDKNYFDRNYLIQNGIDKEQLGSWGDLLIELNNKGHIFHCTEFPNRTKRFGNARILLGNGRSDDRKSLIDAKKEITSRFFSAYAPATSGDLAHWLGITVREAKEYIKLVEDKLRIIECGGKEYYIESSSAAASRLLCGHMNSDDCYLLPKFDPLLLAYRDKSWLADKSLQKRIWRTAGHVEGVVLQRGQPAATWRYKLTHKKIGFEFAPFQHSFSLKDMERNCRKIAFFFERPIDSIRVTEVFI